MLPPLIKGYLAASAPYIGDGAVIDHQFGTTDVLIIHAGVGHLRARYIGHFGADASRHAA
jgi:putative hemolysin